MGFADWIKTELDWRRTVVWGTSTAISDLISRLDNPLPPNWMRNKEAEALYQLRGGAFPSSLCFTRAVEGTEVLLRLNKHSPVRLLGGNVIPARASDYRRLAAETIDQFRRDVLDPALASAGAHLEENRIGLQSQVSPDVMESLWQFVDTAQRVFPLKGQSISDWRDFVISARTANASFDPDEFAAWFERKGWSRTDARLLADKFFEDAWLLSAYDEARKPA